MKKFNLGILMGTAAALALTACGPSYSNSQQYANNDSRVCVDKRTNQRVNDGRCHSRTGGGFAWMYIGRGGYVPGYGGYARGGSYTPSRGVSYATGSAISTRGVTSATARGGFGSSAHGFGSVGA